MKVGIITDIHNNSVALEAILTEFEERGVEKIICCGDIIGIGPNPEECVQMLIQNNKLIACVLGNHERYLTEGFDVKVKMTDGEKAQHKWEHARLSDASKSFIYGLKPYENVVINGKKIHVIHYAIDELGEYLHFGKEPQLEDLEKSFATVDADVVLYGHEHNPSILKGSKLFINAGSVGCPGYKQNVAHGGILHIADEIHYTPLEIVYPVHKVIETINLYRYPDYQVVKEIFYGIKESIYP